MDYLTLNTGASVPQLGFGTIYLKNQEDCDKYISFAIENGYRLIDTAAHYHNTAYVGNTIRNSKINREEFFIISKLGVPDNSYEGCKRAVDKQLGEMKLDYLDLFLIHHPYGDVFGAYRAMEEFYREGVLKAIGVSNFEPYRLMDITINNEIPPAVNEAETNPYCQQKDAKKVMEEFGTKLIGSMPLARGYNNLFTDERFVAIGERYHKTAAQAVLRWHIQKGNIVIPGGKDEAHIRSNIEVFDFELTPEEMAVFDGLDTGDSVYTDRRDPERVRTFCQKKKKAEK